MKLKLLPFAALTAITLVGSANAAVVFSGIAQTTTFTVDSTTPLSIVNADVTTNSEGELNWTSLDDGAFPASAAYPNQQAVAISGDANSNGLIYSLTAGASTIGSISVYSGWSNNGRVEQHYSVYTTTDVSVTGSSAWTLLTTVDGSGNGNSTTFTLAGSENYLKTTVYNDASSTLASGVTGLKFSFAGGQQNGYVGYKEIDVQVIPEPSAALIGGLGMLALLRRRR